MADRLGLRLRFALFFAALSLGGTACILAGLWVGFSRSGGAVSGFVTAGLIASFGLIALTTWVALLFDENVARPILALADELITRAQSGVTSGIDQHQPRYLGALAPSADAIHAALTEARAGRDRAVRERTAHMERDKAILETVLRDLAEGVLVVADDWRILLYNRAAVDVLGPLGLDRGLGRFLRLDPVEAAIRRGTAGLGDQPPRFLAATADAGKLVTGAVSPIHAGNALTGYVILLRDTTEDLRTHEAFAHGLRDLIEGARRPAAAIGAGLDVIAAQPDLEPADRTRFDMAFRQELDRLRKVLDTAGGQQARLTTGQWPIHVTSAQDILDALQARHPHHLAITPTPALALCDGFAVTEVLAAALTCQQKAGLPRPTASAETSGDEVILSLHWQGAPLAQGDLEQAMQAALSPAYGSYTARDALAAHQTDIWVETTPEGARIVLILPAASAPGAARPGPVGDFYDFDLSSLRRDDLMSRPLRDLTFVVFDTETTGLDTERDSIIEIAGVRILRGRVLRGETFRQLANPGRPIPEASTKIHHITDADVADADPPSRAVTAFHGFVGEAVLVAHYAAFDMAMLGGLTRSGGPRFDTPALCTGLISARLFPSASDHTLDGLAARFDITIPDDVRHTALGDALATAEVFVNLLDLLDKRGVTTWQDLAGFLDA